MLQYRAGGRSRNLEGQLVIQGFCCRVCFYFSQNKERGGGQRGNCPPCPGSTGPAIPCFLHLRRHISKVKHVLHMKMK